MAEATFERLRRRAFDRMRRRLMQRPDLDLAADELTGEQDDELLAITADVTERLLSQLSDDEAIAILQANNWMWRHEGSDGTLLGHLWFLLWQLIRGDLLTWVDRRQARKKRTTASDGGAVTIQISPDASIDEIVAILRAHGVTKDDFSLTGLVDAERIMELFADIVQHHPDEDATGLFMVGDTAAEIPSRVVFCFICARLEETEPG